MSAPRVLVVDDNPQNVELLEAYLVPEKYDVVTASDGLEALARVEEALPDIVLLDVMMPNMNGYDSPNHAPNSEPDVPSTSTSPPVTNIALSKSASKLS